MKRILSAPPEKLIKVARKLNAAKGKGFQIPRDPAFSYADLMVEAAGQQWHCLRIRHNSGDLDLFVSPEAKVPSAASTIITPSDPEIVSRETFTSKPGLGPNDHQHTDTQDSSGTPAPNSPEAPHERPRPNESRIVSRETFASKQSPEPNDHRQTRDNHASSSVGPKLHELNEPQNPSNAPKPNTLKPPLKHPTFNKPEIVSRETFASGRHNARGTSGVSSTGQQTNGVISAFSDASDKALLFIYGGGMVSEPDMSDIQPAMRLADHTQREVWFPFYPLCLDYSAMASLEMVYGCYTEMLERWPPQDICVLGYSSGAGLALALCHLLREQQEPQPEKLILFSPGSITDDEAWHERARHLAKRDVLVGYQFLESIKTIMEHGEPLPKWFLKPWSGGFEGFPRCHFWFGGDELLAASIPNFESACCEAEVPYTMTVGEGMCHCYPFIPGPDFPEKQVAFRQIVAQIIGT